MTPDSLHTYGQLLAEISALKQAISALAALPHAQRPLLAQLTQKQQQLASLQLQTGGASLGNGNFIGEIGTIVARDSISGDKVLGNKIINQFFDGQPHEDEERLLHDYLVSLLDS